MERARYIIALCRKAFGAYTPQLIAILVLAFFSSALEGIGISTIIPAFSLVTSATATGNDAISQFIAHTLRFLHIPYSFRTLLFLVALLFVLRIVLLFCIQYIKAHAIFGYERDLREKLFNATLHARWPYLSRQNIGNLEQLLTTNTTNASQFFGNIAMAAITSTKVLIYIIVAINVSWWVALFALLAAPITLFFLKPLFFKNRMVAEGAERANRSLAHFVGEHMLGMKAIKAMAIEDPVAARSITYFQAMKSLNIRSILLRSYIESFVQICGVVFVGILFVIMYRSPGFSIAAFAVIVYAVNQIFAQIQSGQGQLHGFITLVPYIAEVHAYLDRTTEHGEVYTGEGSFAFEHEISFRNVSLSYEDRGTVLDTVSFVIRKGEQVGVVGPSGSGKTTLADLLLRLVEPTRGSVHIDERDVREIPVQSWRSHVGYVAQDAVLLNDTLEQNIRFYNSALSSQDVVEAAKLAHIHDFIESLPKGYNTVVGDRGVLISGGQRQRIALARVLARKPELLVLDEATSSLDAESERAVSNAVEGLRGGITVVIIAHRNTTIEHVDRVLEVKNGSVTEIPRPERNGETV